MYYWVYVMEPQVVTTVVLKGLSGGLRKFVEALPSIKSRVGISFSFPSQSVGMQVFPSRVDMILLDFFF